MFHIQSLVAYKRLNIFDYIRHKHLEIFLKNVTKLCKEIIWKHFKNIYCSLYDVIIDLFKYLKIN